MIYCLHFLLLFGLPFFLYPDLCVHYFRCCPNHPHSHCSLVYRRSLGRHCRPKLHWVDSVDSGKYDCTWDGSVAVVLRKPRDATKTPSLNTPKSHRSFPECCCRGYCQIARWPMNFLNPCADHPKHLRTGKASMFFLGHFHGSLVNGEWIERTRWAKRTRSTRGQHPKRHAWSISFVVKGCCCPPTFIFKRL